MYAITMHKQYTHHHDSLHRLPFNSRFTLMCCKYANMAYILFKSLLLSILYSENLKHIFSGSGGLTTSSVFSPYFSQVDDVEQANQDHQQSSFQPLVLPTRSR
jgi:hypothetical protein